MTTLRDFIKRHSVLTYYALVFAISWGGILLAIGGPDAIPGDSEQVESQLPFVMMALFAGPSVAGFLLTILVYGKAGLRELLARLLRWRVDLRWYAVALLTAPVSYLMILLPISLLSQDFLPGILTTDDRVTLLLFGLASGLVGGGFLEELGWTGFATPELRRRYTVITTGLIIGCLWGAWHLLVVFWLGGSTIGGIPLTLFLTVRGFDLLVGGLVAYRVLMVWVYHQTHGSLLVMMLMHTSLSASMLILQPLALSGTPFLTYCLLWSVAMWMIVGTVAVTHRKQFARQPLRTQVA